MVFSDPARIYSDSLGQYQNGKHPSACYVKPPRVGLRLQMAKSLKPSPTAKFWLHYRFQPVADPEVA